MPRVKHRIHPIDIRIGQRLRIARLQAQMSQEKAAEHLDITYQQIQKYEKGGNRIGPAALILLSHLYDKPVGWFFEGIADSSTPDRGSDQAAQMLATRQGIRLVAAFLALPTPARDALVDVAEIMARPVPALQQAAE